MSSQWKEEHLNNEEEEVSSSGEAAQSPKTITASGTCQQLNINMLQEQDNVQVNDE